MRRGTSASRAAKRNRWCSRKKGWREPSDFSMSYLARKSERQIAFLDDLTQQPFVAIGTCYDKVTVPLEAKTHDQIEHGARDPCFASFSNTERTRESDGD